MVGIAIVQRVWMAGSLLVSSLLAGCAPVPVAEPIFDTPESAIQEAIAEELGMPVALRVETYNHQGDWAFVTGQPLTLDREPIDYTKTPYAKDLAEGYFDDNFVALVRSEKAEGGGWVVVELSIGATDAPFVDWTERHRLPGALIKSVPGR